MKKKILIGVIAAAVLISVFTGRSGKKESEVQKEEQVITSSIS